MRVLIACEFSGTVRDAFREQGHDAWSCDLLPSESSVEGFHYTGDVLDVIRDTWGAWDLMIAHPPCTYLSNAGVRWLHSQPERWKLMADGAAFFRQLLEAPIPRIAVENPIMHGYARELVGRRADQCVQPYQFGHLEQKGTCLWLKNLPQLIPTSDLKAETMALPEGQRQKMFYKSPGPNRWKERSITYQGIADAMADQWGSLPVE